MDRVFASEAKGRWFDSSHGHHVQRASRRVRARGAVRTPVYKRSGPLISSGISVKGRLSRCLRQNRSSILRIPASIIVNMMKVIGDWLLIVQKAIHVGTALWFMAVLMFVHPEWSEEWRDVRLLLAINVGAAALNFILYCAISFIIRSRAK